MNKTELIAAMVEKAEISKKDAEKALTAFTNVVADTLVDRDKVSITGFGTSEVVERAARIGRTPAQQVNLFRSKPLNLPSLRLVKL